MNNQDSQNRAIRFWLDCTKDNFIAAKAMFKAGRWSLCMFMCQQTIETLLKAVYILNKQERPKYLHKLSKLLDLTEVKVPKIIDEMILSIDAHYIKARYKEDRFNSRVYNKVSAQRIIKDTEEVILWFTKNLKLKV